MQKIAILIMALGAASCGSPETESLPSEQTAAVQEPAEPTSQQISFAEGASPSDASISEIYDRSCRVCHAVAGMNAPLTGHGDDWQYRISLRGKDGMLKSAKDGFEMMPAMGQCLDCSDEQFLELIDFMAADGAQ